MRLTDWGIAPSSTYDVRIEGYCEISGKFVATADILNRLSRRRIECVDGKRYELVGPFDRVSGMEGNIPSRILDAFVHGVPENWRHVIRGWSEQESTIKCRGCREAGITSKDRAHPRQRCPADESFQKMQRHGVSNSQQHRHQRQSRATFASVSSSTKQQSTPKSSVGIAGSNTSPVRLKKVKIVVERLPAAVLLEIVNGASAVGPNSSTPTRASTPGTKTRNQSSFTQVSLSGKARSKVQKELEPTMGTLLRSRSCPATQARGVPGGRTDEECTRARPASAQRNLRSTKQDKQATRDANEQIKTASTCKMLVKEQSISGNTDKKTADKKTAFLKSASVTALPVAKPALPVLATWMHRKEYSQGQKKGTKQKEKLKLGGGQRSSRGEQRHCGYDPEKVDECKSSSSVQTRIGCNSARKSELEVKAKSPCVLPPTCTSSMDSSRQSACGMEQTGMQLRSYKRDMLSARQQKATKGLRKCTSAIIGKQYSLRTNKSSITELNSARQKVDNKSSLSEHRNEVAEDSILRTEHECKHSASECVQTRSGHYSPSKNTESKGKLGAKSLHVLPAKHKLNLDSVQSAASGKQQTDVPHRSRTSHDNMFAKQHKATDNLGECSSTINQQRPSHTRSKTDSAESIPVKQKLDGKKSSGTQNKLTRKSNRHPEVQEKRRYNTRSCALASPLAGKSRIDLSAKHKLNLGTFHCTAGGKQRTAALRRSSTSGKNTVTKQEKATKDEAPHSSPIVRTRSASSTKFNTGSAGSVSGKGEQKLSDRLSGHQNEVTGQRGVSLNRRIASTRKRASTCSPGMSKTSCKTDVNSKSASRKQKLSTGSSGRQDGTVRQRRARKRKYSLASSPELLPTKKTSRGISQTNVAAKVASRTMSSRADTGSTVGKQKPSETSTGLQDDVSQEDVHSKNQREPLMKSVATSSPLTLPEKTTTGDISEAKAVKNDRVKKHSNGTGRKRRSSRKQQMSVKVHSTGIHADSPRQHSGEGTNTSKSEVQVEQTASESRRTSELGVPSTSKMGRSEQVEPFAKPQPCKRGHSTNASSQDLKSKASESTEALLAITARKGTLKRKAQIKKLTDALAAKEACDDIYQARASAANIPDYFVMPEQWDDLSDFRASRMTTPVPNSPHLSPGKSQFSFSSVGSASTPESPIPAAAIMQALRKQGHAANMKSSTPKSRYMKKSQNVKVVAKGLRNLEARLEKERLKENCEDSDEEVEDTDFESSQEDEQFLFN
nr:mucin-4-like [Dermacentor andersoni]